MKSHRIIHLAIIVTGLLNLATAYAENTGLIVESTKPLTSLEMAKAQDLNNPHPFVFCPADATYKQAKIGDVFVLHTKPAVANTPVQDIIAVVTTPDDYRNFIERNGKVIQPGYAPLVLSVNNQTVNTPLFVMFFDKDELTNALSRQGKNDRALQAWFVGSKRMTATNEGPYASVIRAVKLDYPR